MNYHQKISTSNKIMLILLYTASSMDKTEQLRNSNFKTTNHNLIRHNCENANTKIHVSFL